MQVILAHSYMISPFLTDVDSFAKFYEHNIGSYHAYESVHFLGRFLVMDDQGRVTLDTPDFTETTSKYKFTKVLAGGQHIHLTAVTASGATCYLAFDFLGVQLANPCAPLSALATEQAKFNILTTS